MTTPTKCTLAFALFRGGDKGETSLGDGSRRKKHDLRVEAYGTVDEANATIGLARLHTSGDVDALLSRVQNDLFDLGADLCTPEEQTRRSGALRTTVEQVAQRFQCKVQEREGERDQITGRGKFDGAEEEPPRNEPQNQKTL